MKFIGQYIQSFIARFRSDVYLEDISTGTIASGGNLGLDSNNKIVKANEASGDITGVSITTDSGGGSRGQVSSGSADFSILGTSGVGVTNSTTTITVTSVPGEIDHDSLLNFAANEHYTQANITTVGTIGTGVWQGTAIASAYLDSDTAHLTTDQTFTGKKTFSDDVTFNCDTVTFESANADDPIVTIKNTSNATNDMASLKFVKDRGATPGVGDNLAEIYFIGEDADQNSQEYGRILCETDVVTGGQESGVIKMGVANHDGGNGYGLIMTGGSANDEVDVSVGLGAASVTTIAGTLTMGSTAAMTNAGLLSVANQSNITGLGTISSGVWQGTAIATAYIADDAVTENKLANTLLAEIDANTAKVTNVATNLGRITGVGSVTITSSDGDNVTISEATGSAAGLMSVTHHDKLDSIEAGAKPDQSNAEILTAIEDGVDSVHYVDGSIDTAHIADDQVTFAKAVGVTPNIYGSIIKVLPSDFMANEEPGVTKTLQFVDNDASGIKPGDNNTELIAFVSIPETMKATHVDVYADDTLAFSVYELNIHESVGDISAASKGTGNCNTTLDITDVNATATNYLLIQVITVSKADRVFGAKVTIATQ